MRQHGTHIGLSGVIVGGGQRADGPGMLGVFLDHDPTDFGISRHAATHIGELRTGLSEAIQTDLEDDSYDLSWLSALSGTKSPADIVTLRKLLEAENDPIDRHFMLAELGGCLYRCRAAFSSALEEFDAVREQHHVEMEATIRAALYAKFESVPLVEMYRQATIRWQKAHDWERMETWAKRGLAMYGENPARPEAVEDLAKRLAYAQAKLAAPAKPPAHRAEMKDPRQSPALATEVLTCATCGNSFERQRTRGRKPTRCPVCSGSRGYVSA
jgi:rubrerythrin